MRCTVCKHPAREEIDRAIVRQEKPSRIARQFGLSRWAVMRHKNGDLVEFLAASRKAADIARADDLLGEIGTGFNRTDEIYQEAREAKDGRLALLALGERRAHIELRARVAGELKDRTINVTNVNISPEQAERIARVYLERLPPGEEDAVEVTPTD